MTIEQSGSITQSTKKLDYAKEAIFRKIGWFN